MGKNICHFTNNQANINQTNEMHTVPPHVSARTRACTYSALSDPHTGKVHTHAQSAGIISTGTGMRGSHVMISSNTHPSAHMGVRTHTCCTSTTHAYALRMCVCTCMHACASQETSSPSCWSTLYTNKQVRK